MTLLGGRLVPALLALAVAVVALLAWVAGVGDAQAERRAGGTLDRLALPASEAVPVETSDGCVTTAASRCWRSDLPPRRLADALARVEGWRGGGVLPTRAIPGSGGSYSLHATVSGTPFVAIAYGHKVRDQADGRGPTRWAGSVLQVEVDANR